MVVQFGSAGAATLSSKPVRALFVLRGVFSTSYFLHKPSLQSRRILGGRNLVRVRNIVVATIFDFMTVEDWGE